MDLQDYRIDVIGLSGCTSPSRSRYEGDDTQNRKQNTKVGGVSFPKHPGKFANSVGARIYSSSKDIISDDHF